MAERNLPQAADNTNIQVAKPEVPPIVTTQPDHILRHSISDEELDMLCETRTHGAFELFLLACGAVIGSAPSAVAGILQYFSGTGELRFQDFVHILIFIGGFFFALGMNHVRKGRNLSSLDLRDKIRSRTGVPDDRD